MSQRERGNALSRLTAKLFKLSEPLHKIEAQQDIDLNGRLEHVMSFSTGKDRDPLSIHFKLFPLTNGWDKGAWRLYIETEGCRHPYDAEGRLNYFGIETMNPALLTSIERITKTFIKIEQHVHSYTGTPQVFGQNEKSNARLNFHGPRLWLSFNERLDTRPQSKYAQIAEFYNFAIGSFEEERPAIEQHIQQSAILQPPPNPSAETLLLFEAEMGSIMFRKLSEDDPREPGRFSMQPDGSLLIHPSKGPA